MKHRSFITKSASAGPLTGTGWPRINEKIAPHNWDEYDFGPPSPVKNRLNQSLLSNYEPVATVPGANVVVVTTPSTKPIQNFGMGMVTYICDEVGPNYFSLWNWHNISLENLLDYYETHPEHLDGLAAKIGCRVRPSWIWYFEKDGYPGLALGLVNDGIAAVPGALYISAIDEAETVITSGSLDPCRPSARTIRTIPSITINYTI